jgi:ATP-dependent RNA helicase DDX1
MLNSHQTLNQLQLFKKHLSQPVVKELLVVGGVRAQEQIAALKAGVDIVVATPGEYRKLFRT